VLFVGNSWQSYHRMYQHPFLALHK
jgi:hypothetical protein